MQLIPFTHKQEDSIMLSNARLNIWEGSVRSSKTITSLFALARFCISGEPQAPLVLSGKTQDTIKRNISEPLTELFGNDWRHDTGNREAWLFGQKFWVVGANDERAELRIRGLTAGGAYCDEITTYPESFWTMLLSRMSTLNAKLFGTTNPDSPYHWLKIKFLDRIGELDLRVFHFKLTDNPALPESYIRNLQLEYGPGTLAYRRFIEGAWVLAEGVIYDMWDEDRFVTNKRPERAAIIDRDIGLDYGTAHPFDAVMGEVSAWPDGYERIWITDEYRYDPQEHGGVQKAPSQYSEDMGAWIGPRAYSSIFVDPSAADFANQLYRDGFIGVTPADNEVLPGLRIVSSLLVNDRIRVHESCRGIRMEMPGYVWDEKAQKLGLDKPLKQRDDALDALRYDVMGQRKHWRKWLIREQEPVA